MSLLLDLPFLCSTGRCAIPLSRPKSAKPPRAAAVQGGRKAGAKQLYPGRSRARRHARLLLGSPLVWLVSFAVLMVASVPNELNRILSKPVAVWIGSGWDHRQTDRGRRDKSADCRRAFLVGRVGVTEHRVKSPADAFARMSEKTIAPEPSLIPSSWGRL